MERLGIISGMYALKESLFSRAREEVRENTFGRALVFISENVVFIPRHGNPHTGHILPHLINHQANMQALADLGVKRVFALNSTGSLKIGLKPGTFVVPCDFIALNQTPGMAVRGGVEDHIVPVLSARVRQDIIEAARMAGIEDLVTDGVYWQTTGPRLETRAEIRLLAQFADVVGMTMADEAVAACEMGLEYGSLCSIDNYAHGIGPKTLTLEEIQLASQGQRERIVRIIHCYLEKRP